jgi:hypothetical protein
MENHTKAIATLHDRLATVENRVNNEIEEEIQNTIKAKMAAHLEVSAKLAVNQRLLTDLYKKQAKAQTRLWFFAFAMMVFVTGTLFVPIVKILLGGP